MKLRYLILHVTLLILTVTGAVALAFKLLEGYDLGLLSLFVLTLLGVCASLANLTKPLIVEELVKARERQRSLDPEVQKDLEDYAKLKADIDALEAHQKEVADAKYEYDKRMNQLAIYDKDLQRFLIRKAEERKRKDAEEEHYLARKRSILGDTK